MQKEERRSTKKMSKMKWRARIRLTNEQMKVAYQQHPYYVEQLESMKSLHKLVDMVFKLNRVRLISHVHLLFR